MTQGAQVQEGATSILSNDFNSTCLALRHLSHLFVLSHLSGVLNSHGVMSIARHGASAWHLHARHWNRKTDRRHVTGVLDGLGVFFPAPWCNMPAGF